MKVIIKNFAVSIEGYIFKLSLVWHKTIVEHPVRVKHASNGKQDMHANPHSTAESFMSGERCQWSGETMQLLLKLQNPFIFAPSS